MPCSIINNGIIKGDKLGAYKLGTICNDIDIVVEGYSNYISEKMKLIATEMIYNLPDNIEKDLAISSLLGAARLMKASLIKGEETTQTSVTTRAGKSYANDFDSIFYGY